MRPKSILSIGVQAIALGMIFLVNHPVCAAENHERAYGKHAYTGKIIDAHNHPRMTGKKRLAKYLSEASKAGVERIVVLTEPRDYLRAKKIKATLKRAARFPVVTVLCSANFVGYYLKGELERARKAVAKIKRDLDRGRCAGIGEIGLRHYDKMWSRGGGQHELVVPLDFPLLHEALAAANKHAVPVVFHIEPFYKPRSIDDLAEIKRWYKRICVKYPRARLIAAHTGMMSAADLEELLQSCPNLFSDFKVLFNKGAVSNFADLDGVNNLDFRFFEDWAEMFEKYPDRFIFGSDWKEGGKGGWRNANYIEHIERVRKMIGSLLPSVQRNLAYLNAKRVFRLP